MRLRRQPARRTPVDQRHLTDFDAIAVSDRHRTGTITSANLINTLAGQPLSALIALIESGNAYANVHTNDGVGATNTGPGDYPGGEIRGQIRK